MHASTEALTYIHPTFPPPTDRQIRQVGVTDSPLADAAKKSSDKPIASILNCAVQLDA